MLKLEELYYEIKLDLAKLQAELNQAKGQFQGFTNQVNTEGGKIDSMFSKLGPMIAGAFSVAALMNFSRQIIQARSEFETMQISFEAMLGSKAQADKLMAEAIDFASKHAFSPKEVEDAVRTLVHFGVSANDVIKELKMLGDIATGTGGSVSELAHVYGVMMADGKVAGIELRRFAMQGIPIYEELAKVMKISATNVKGFADEGKIGFPEVQKVLQNLTSEGGKFADLSTKNASTLKGMISGLKTAWDEFLIGLGESSAWKKVIGYATDFVNKMREGMVSQVEKGSSSGMQKVTEFTKDLKGLTQDQALAKINEEIKKDDVLWNTIVDKQDERMQQVTTWDKLWQTEAYRKAKGDIFSLGELQGGPLTNYSTMVSGDFIKNQARTISDGLKELIKSKDWFEKLSETKKPVPIGLSKQDLDKMKAEYATYENIAAIAGKDTADAYSKGLAEKGVDFADFLRRMFEKYRNNPAAISLIADELGPIISKQVDELFKETEKDFDEFHKANIQAWEDDLKASKENEAALTDVTDLMRERNEKTLQFYNDLKLTYGTLKERLAAVTERIVLEATNAGLDPNNKTVQDVIKKEKGKIYTEDLAKYLQTFSQLVDLAGKFSGQLGNIGKSMLSVGEGIGNMLIGFSSANYLQGVSGILEVMGSLPDLMEQVNSGSNDMLETQARLDEKNLETQQKILDILRAQQDYISREFSLIDKMTGPLGLLFLQQQVTDTANVVTQLENKLYLLGHYNWGFGIDIQTVSKTIENLQIQLAKAQAYQKPAIQIQIDQWTALYDAMINAQDAQNQLNEAMTGTTAQKITDSIVQGFEAGKRSAADFADTTADVIRGAIMKAFEIKYLDSAIASFYDSFAKAAEGGLTLEELTTEKTQLQMIIDYAGKQWDLIKEMLGNAGISAISVISQTGLSGAIKGITEDTAGLLEGQMNAIRINVLDQLIVATASMNYLAKIEGNTRLIVTSASLLYDIRGLLAGNLQAINMLRSIGH